MHRWLQRIQNGQVQFLSTFISSFRIWSVGIITLLIWCTICTKQIYVNGNVTTTADLVLRCWNYNCMFSIKYWCFLQVLYNFIWSVICNSYLAQPIKKQTCKWSHTCQWWLNIHGMYLRQGHYYELKSPYNLIYIYACFNGNNAYDKWAHRVILTLLAGTLNPLCMIPSGVVWAFWTVKGLSVLPGCFGEPWQ